MEGFRGVATEKYGKVLKPVDLWTQRSCRMDAHASDHEIFFVTPLYRPLLSTQGRKATKQMQLVEHSRLEKARIAF